jgi:hypothetical protein
VSSEETLITTHNHGDYRTGERSEAMSAESISKSLATYDPTVGLSKLSCIFFFA